MGNMYQFSMELTCLHVWNAFGFSNLSARLLRSARLFFLLTASRKLSSCCPQSERETYFYQSNIHILPITHQSTQCYTKLTRHCNSIEVNCLGYLFTSLQRLVQSRTGAFQLSIPPPKSFRSDFAFFDSS
jgi:hypothetical protein